MVTFVLSACFLPGETMIAQEKNQSHHKIATFAGGCFWCMVQPFEKTDGVIEVISGYAGGTEENPTYQDYAQKGYVEVIQVTYDPKKVSYGTLLDVFWRQIDPTDAGGQFFDRGPQYRSAIFYHTSEQKKAAEESKQKLQASGRFSKNIMTDIIKASTFSPAEQYHQQYYKKNPEHYASFKKGSGREQFLEKTWRQSESKFNDALKKLTPLQCDVIQCSGTEPAFKNEYWDNKAAGIYVDRVSGEPLFSSLDKYDSGTGWPSFTKPLEPENIVERVDNNLSVPRTEVRSKMADSHLGHVFNDGPKPTGLRYCMNSAALRFIPVEDLEKEGYGQYLSLFKNETANKNK